MTNIISSPLQLFGIEEPDNEKIYSSFRFVFKPDFDVKGYTPGTRNITNILCGPLQEVEAAIIYPLTDSELKITVQDLNMEQDRFVKAFAHAMRHDPDIMIFGIVNKNTDFNAIKDQIFTAAETGHAVYMIHEPGCEFLLSYDDWVKEIMSRQ